MNPSGSPAGNAAGGVVLSDVMSRDRSMNLFARCVCLPLVLMFPAGGRANSSPRAAIVS